jgi:hypothetical protein
MHQHPRAGLPEFASLGCDNAESNPVIATLSSVLRLSLECGGAAEWIRSSFQYAAEEVAAGRRA